MIQHRILYRVIDEDGIAHVGRAFGEEDVRQLLEKLKKKHRDAQLYHLELEETVESIEPPPPFESMKKFIILIRASYLQF